MKQVSETSDLVLFAADLAIYKTDSARKFSEKLNLKDIRSTLEENLGAELLDLLFEEINNRKVGVKRLCTEHLTATPHSQVVFLGAGLDPKSLDVAESFPHATVFDVDMDHMVQKEKMTKEVNGPKNIFFCLADVRDVKALRSSLEKAGWDGQKETLIVAEGICYYISKALFKEVLFGLRAPGGGLIWEYAIPNDDIVPLDKQEKAKHIFNFLQDSLSWPTPLERFRESEARAWADELGGTSFVTLDAIQLEKYRKGRNEHYSNSFRGILRVSYLKFV